MKVELLQLMMTKGIGNVSLSNILDYINNNDESLEVICNDKSKLSYILKCKSDIIENFIRNKEKAENLYKILLKNNIKILTKNDLKFPQQLMSVLGKDCPSVIFAKGNIDLLTNNSVGFCGSRNVSDKGLLITNRCAEQLVANNFTIVSGYAKGTDIAAHSSAMRSSGNTIFVLAEGILNFSIKPSIRDYLTNDNHVFISQFIPNSIWSSANAMKRNSLIIGLSKAMILIESRNSGGTYAAGVETLKRKLPLFVVDYSSPGESAEANRFFIDNGGKPIRGKNNIPNLSEVISVSNMIERPISSVRNTEQITWDNISESV